MEKIVDNLRDLKKRLPVNCTQSNLLKLHSAFSEYKYLLNNLPGNFQEIKKMYGDNLDFLDLKINAITDKANSNRDAKYYFKDALQYMHAELDSIILSVELF